MSAGVAAIAVTQKAEASAVTEVAAMRTRNTNRNGNRGGRRGGNNSGNSSNTGRQPKPRPTVPDGCCDNHKKWAANAWFCLDPHKCPMKNQNAVRPDKKKDESNK